MNKMDKKPISYKLFKYHLVDRLTEGRSKRAKRQRKYSLVL
jgi:hypothetical protein